MVAEFADATKKKKKKSWMRIRDAQTARRTDGRTDNDMLRPSYIPSFRLSVSSPDPNANNGGAYSPFWKCYWSHPSRVLEKRARIKRRNFRRRRGIAEFSFPPYSPLPSP